MAISKGVLVVLDIAIGVILATIGVLEEDPIFLSGAVWWLLMGMIGARERRMERKIGELHERIDRLASKIR